MTDVSDEIAAFIMKAARFSETSDNVYNTTR
jgi:hypothetical protein